MAKKSKLTMIPLVEALDFPQEVEDWCVENDVSTHYDNSVAVFSASDKNPLIEFVKKQGFEPPKKGYFHIAVLGT